MGQTKVEVTRITDTGDQLFLLTLRLVALVSENLLLLLALTVLLYVGRHSQVRNCATWYWNRRVAERTHWNLDILLVQTLATVIVIWEMVFAKKFITGITLHGEVVKLLAEGVTAVRAHVR